MTTAIPSNKNPIAGTVPQLNVKRIAEATKQKLIRAISFNEFLKSFEFIEF
jgi:hypothetical protein